MRLQSVGVNRYQREPYGDTEAYLERKHREISLLNDCKAIAYGASAIGYDFTSQDAVDVAAASRKLSDRLMPKAIKG
jgi:hypothetical protein